MIYLFLGAALIITAAMLVWCAVVPDPKGESSYVDPAKTAGGCAGKHQDPYLSEHDPEIVERRLRR